MSGRSLLFAWGAVLFLSGPIVAAEPEQLPAPRPMPGQAVPAPVYHEMPHHGYYRTDRRAVWQYYQVDRYGWWKPVVVWGPHGAYYLYNGQPVPWVVNYNRWVLPTMVGTPYRAAD